MTVREFCNKNIFKELFNEINYLQTNGIIVNLENQNYTIYFSLAFIIGDNLGLHSILGFRKSFNANYPCRFCLCSKSECNYLVTQDDSKMRNREMTFFPGRQHRNNLFGFAWSWIELL